MVWFWFSCAFGGHLLSHHQDQRCRVCSLYFLLVRLQILMLHLKLYFKFTVDFYMIWSSCTLLHIDALSSQPSSTEKTSSPQPPLL